MLPRLLSSAALATGLALATPGFTQDTATPDTVMATVGGTDITLGHMLSLRASLPQQYDQLTPDILFTGVLDQLIQQTLLMQALEGDLSRAAQLRLENERRAIMAADAVEVELATAVTEEALQQAYESRYTNAEPETEYKAAHILVETEEEAQKLVEEIAGGANFAALAQEHSIGPSGPSGGDLGWFGDGVMVPEFFDAVAALEVGTVSDPVQTQFGWHVIKLSETRIKERPALDAVREDLLGELRQQAFEAYLASLESAADITRTDSSGFDPALINQTDLLEN
ncbi:peptidyl-prolyl cis-trans isomerase C [Roseovarius azorensis]|uniref:Parvulin-like PPIase n=1 Tax=Roseovarius azorensis TaxID=1287727 RepID=A0A1H7PJS9_9RHOB|nr:peptidylprolyl isomerase [Roseovarius azorensis]SEL35849.1 peptidyl-prolyl cis-trans isomerase C [Roseovarius azorensis]